MRLAIEILCVCFVTTILGQLCTALIIGPEVSALDGIFHYLAGSLYAVYAKDALARDKKARDA